MSDPAASGPAASGPAASGPAASGPAAHNGPRGLAGAEPHGGVGAGAGQGVGLVQAEPRRPLAPNSCQSYLFLSRSRTSLRPEIRRSIFHFMLISARHMWTPALQPNVEATKIALSQCALRASKAYVHNTPFSLNQSSAARALAFVSLFLLCLSSRGGYRHDQHSSATCFLICSL